LQVLTFIIRPTIKTAPPKLKVLLKDYYPARLPAFQSLQSEDVRLKQN
jgi:hypothetical protein